MTNTATAADWKPAEEIALAHQGEQRKPVTPYYDPANSSYWIEGIEGDWIKVNETSIRRHLRAQGISSKEKEGAYVSNLDSRLNDIQRAYSVSYAGVLAGYQRGVHRVGDERVLVTRSPKIIQPKAGQWPTINKLVENLFVDDTIDQRPYVFGWLKVAYEALASGVRRPGQAIVFAGEHDSGKSLMQNLITPMLGGAAAKPYRYMSGATPFNADLFGAVHLMIEDEFASTDIRVRRCFGAQIKNFTVNEVQSCHAKNRQAISLTPLWRLSISVNCEVENLMILPPMDSSIEDKLMLLKVQKREMPMRTGSLEERRIFWETLCAELPAFISFLCEWEIPRELRSERFGVTHFHHPELLEAVEALAPEVRLLAIIDTAFFSPLAKRDRWEGTADELRSELTEAMPRALGRLLEWDNAPGVYLGRLAAKYPSRVSEHRTSARREWIIRPPTETSAGQEDVSAGGSASRA